MDLKRRAYIVLAWIGIALIAVAVGVVAIRGDWSGVAVLGVFLVASILFVAVEKRLPAVFDLLFVLAAMINAAGWVWNLYHTVWVYDEVAHFYTTFAGTLSLGYLLFYGMREHFREHGTHFVVVLTSFGVTLGAWWEVVEWVALEKITDPVGDIIVDSLGALLAAGVALWVLRRQDPEPAGHRRER